MIRLSTLVVAFVLSAGLAGASTLNNLFTGYFALGDSLSDPGNLYAATGQTQPPAPYVNGRFSNGPVFTEYLASGFAPGTTANFAYGGARAVNPNNGSPLPLHLDTQLALFEQAAAGGAAQGSLVTMLFGANDIFQELDAIIATQPANPFPQLFNTAMSAAMAVGSAVSTIASYGPAQIVVMNLPDIGATPAYGGTALAPLATYATNVFNSAVASLTAFSTASTTVSVFDLNGFFAAVQADPAAYGLDPTLAGTPCLLTGAGPDCAGYLFADLVHPTTAAHGVLANAVAASVGAQIAPVPLPAGLPLLAAGLGLLMVVRRRQAA